MLLLVTLYSSSFSLQAQSTVTAKGKLQIHELIRIGRGTTTSAIWSPDGDILAVGGSQGIWLYTPELNDINHFDNIGGTSDFPIYWSPDGKSIGVAGYHDIEILNVVTGEITTIENASYPRTSITWSPDSTKIASAALKEDEKVIRVWDVKTKQILTTFTGHTAKVNGLSWSPDGSQIASASNDRTVRVWDVSTGQTVQTLSADIPANMYEVAWSPNGTYLAATGYTNEKARALLWDTKNYESSIVTTSDQYLGSVTWSPDSERLAMVVWTISTNQVVVKNVITNETSFTLQDNSSYGAIPSISWSPSDNIITTSSYSAEVNNWDATTGKLIAKLEKHSRPVIWVSWNPKRDLIAVTHYYSNTIKILDSQTGNNHISINTGTPILSPGYPEQEFVWSLDGEYLAGILTSSEPHIKIWKVLATDSVLTTTLNNVGKPKAIAWSPDNKLLGGITDMGSLDPQWQILIWNTQSGDVISQPRDKSREVINAEWASKTWDYVATDSSMQSGEHLDTQLELRDGNTFETVQVFPKQEDGDLPTDFVWDEQRNRIIGYFRSPSDVTLFIWDIKSNKVITPFPNLPISVTSNLVISPNGAILALADLKNLYLWDMETYQLLGQIEEYGSIVSLSWNSDGTKLVSGNEDGSIHIYQIDS